MSELKRYDLDKEYPPEMFTCVDGDYVLYTDHLAIVESLRKQLEEAEAEIERAIRLTLNECFEYHSQVDARQHQKSIAEAVLAQLKEQKNG